MRSVEMKNRCLLYYGNPVGYRTEQGVVADSMFRREELEDWASPEILPYLAARPLSSRRHALHWAGPHEW